MEPTSLGKVPMGVLAKGIKEPGQGSQRPTDEEQARPGHQPVRCWSFASPVMSVPGFPRRPFNIKYPSEPRCLRAPRGSHCQSDDSNAVGAASNASSMSLATNTVSSVTGLQNCIHIPPKMTLASSDSPRCDARGPCRASVNIRGSPKGGKPKHRITNTSFLANEVWREAVWPLLQTKDQFTTGLDVDGE